MITEYRVWVHPSLGGDDTYYKFSKLGTAVAFYRKFSKPNQYFDKVERPIVATYSHAGRELYAQERYATKSEVEAALRVSMTIQPGQDVLTWAHDLTEAGW